MKYLLVSISLMFTFSSFAQSIVTAKKNNEGADLCFFKQVQLEGYAYANIIGKCAWDPAMNGMFLTLVAVPEDPTQDAHSLDLDNIRGVKVVKSKSRQVQLTVTQDNFDSNENISQKTKVIHVRAINPKKGIFSIHR